MQVRQVTKETLIFKEGGCAQHFFVVAHGEFELLKAVQDQEGQMQKSSGLELSAFQHRTDNYNHTYKAAKGRRQTQISLNIQGQYSLLGYEDSLQGLFERFLLAKIHALKAEEQMTEGVAPNSRDQIITDPLQLLGEEYLQSYQYSAKCITQTAEVLIIDRQDFALQLWGCPIETWEEISHIIKQRISKLKQDIHEKIEMKARQQKEIEDILESDNLRDGRGTSFQINQLLSSGGQRQRRLAAFPLSDGKPIIKSPPSVTVSNFFQYTQQNVSMLESLKSRAPLLSPNNLIKQRVSQAANQLCLPDINNSRLSLSPAIALKKTQHHDWSTAVTSQQLSSNHIKVTLGAAGDFTTCQSGSNRNRNLAISLLQQPSNFRSQQRVSQAFQSIQQVRNE
ncbi:hypothetical protein FGO68_gene11605 [Halteria grandinella]|uniref:Cyclic nucleotide-binding domain-containing protein n=1 Tax=Halteria grandinella TaxID=5974 RepID=A0A8J8P2E8_HALGN|nr:hypothetical protein FGO68_gene11605 [Halteria grandinella]